MKMVLIGGGNIGRADTDYETKQIDEKVVRLSEKTNPKFLFIGLASEFSDSYYKIIKDIYKNLGCETGKISNKTLTHMEVVEQKINNADIIYLGGGDTVKLVNILKETKMDVMIKNAIERNCVIVGISAGAIACCKYGLSDYEIISNISNDYVKINGIGYLDYMFVPHFSSDQRKKKTLESILSEDKGIKALCADDCAAIIIDKKMSVIKSSIKANAYVASYDEKLTLQNI